ncbi:DUF802 domain-containing protein [Variovorax sp. LARHSF232]
MNRSSLPLQIFAFVLGLVAIGWAGAGYIASNPLALAVTLVIGAFFLMGALELRRFHLATASLQGAVSDVPASPPASLGAWLDRLHPSLRNAVRLRIEGERVGLPGPALTPYLTGLLVLLGMLGTFLGMVVTLSGTGTALASASDMQAVRSSLAAPVQGLGLAFGTSLAGIAASAMLGLMAALCRRDRLQVAQLLDARIATDLRVFSQAHQRDESFRLLQQQSQLMPALIDKLHAMMTALERQGQSLNERLLANQDGFHAKAEQAYSSLAASVGQSLKESLTESARAAGATIQPVVESTMNAVADTFERRSATLVDKVSAQTQHTMDHVSSQMQATMGEVSSQLRSTVEQLSANWRAALTQHEQVSGQLSASTQQALVAATASLEQHAASLLQTLGTAHASLHENIAAKDQQRLAAWSDSLQAMAASLQQEWQQAGERSLGQQQAICQTLAQTADDISAKTEAHARGTIAEIAQLVQAASEAPRAAAEVMAELRQKLSDSMARDNSLLEERERILTTLDTLLGAVNHAATEQRAAIDALVAASADLMERVGTRFAEAADAQTGKLAEVADAQAGKLAGVTAQVSASAVEVASLGEAFGAAVDLFSQSNDKLATHLQRIEGALTKVMTRSDEQLDYYVAQAREVVDLSIRSQKQIVEDLQQIAGQKAAAGSVA